MRLSPSRSSLLLAAALAAAPLAPAAFGEPRTTDHYLEIPGVGRVPIPLPPGARLFSPPRRAAPPPPAEPEPRREAARDSLDDLFRRLALAESEEEESALASAIGRHWARSGSPTADLLMRRAALAATAGSEGLALELLDRIVALEPGWSEALVGRADLRLSRGDVDGAERDLEAAIRLEPRRFDALGALGALFERAGAPDRALAAYRRARAIDPLREEWRKAEERLGLEVEGRDI